MGGLRGKVRAAHRAGLRTVIAPEENRPDLDDIPARVRKQMRFVWVTDMDTVLATVLMNEAAATDRQGPAAASGSA